MPVFDWNELDSCDMFAVTAHLIGKFNLSQEELNALSVDWVVSADGFEVFAYLFRKETLPVLVRDKLTQTGVGSFAEEVAVVLTTQAEEDHLLPLVVDKNAKVDCVCDVEPPRDDDEAYGKFCLEEGLKDIVPILEQFSRITGVHVCFHANFDGRKDGLPDVAPVVPFDGRMHIFTRQHPDGDTEKEQRYIEKAFGIILAREKGEHVRCVQFVKGRGVLVRDDSENVLAQILSGNFYFLIPLFWNYEKEKTATVFKKLLVAAWNEHKRNEAFLALKQEVRGGCFDAPSFASLTREWIMKKPSLLQEDIRKLDEAIHETQEKLTVLMREKREKSIFYQILSSSVELCGLIDKVSGDYEKIMALPLVEDVVLCDDGIHVITGPIDVEGVRVADSYTIRINEHGCLSIWTDTPHHPQAIPHPHINEYGHPCFGNSTNAITQAVSEYRCFDTIRYILEWMVNGYTPELALHRIDEWVSQTL